MNTARLGCDTNAVFGQRSGAWIRRRCASPRSNQTPCVSRGVRSASSFLPIRRARGPVSRGRTYAYRSSCSACRGYFTERFDIWLSVPLRLTRCGPFQSGQRAHLNSSSASGTLAWQRLPVRPRPVPLAPAVSGPPSAACGRLRRSWTRRPPGSDFVPARAAGGSRRSVRDQRL